MAGCRRPGWLHCACMMAPMLESWLLPMPVLVLVEGCSWCIRRQVCPGPGSPATRLAEHPRHCPWLAKNLPREGG